MTTPSLLAGMVYVPASKTNVAATMAAYARRNGIDLPRSIINMAKTSLPVSMPANQNKK